MRRRLAARSVLALATLVLVLAVAPLLATPAQAQTQQQTAFLQDWGAVANGSSFVEKFGWVANDAMVVVGTLLTMTGVGAGIGSALVIGGALSMMMMNQSCPVFVGDSTLLGEDSCIWANATGQKTTQFSATSDSLAWRAGGQKEVGPGWFVGGALGFGTSWSQTSIGPTSRGQTIDGGVVLKHVAGPFLFSGGLAFATTSNHNDRPIGLPNGSIANMQSDSTVLQGGLRLRGAYDVVLDGWYLRPRLDIDLNHTSLSGFQEYGPASALSISPFNRTGVALTPAVEIGGRIDLGPTVILRPYLSVGASFLPSNTWTVNGSIAGTGFTGTINGPNVTGNLEAGLQLYEVKGWEVKVDYRLSAAESFLSQSLGLRGAWHF